MKRRSTSHSRGLPPPSVPVPSTRTTPTKPLKSVMALGSPPVPGTVEATGPGRLKGASGPPNGGGREWRGGGARGLGMGGRRGRGRGATLGRLRSSRRSRDNGGRADRHREPRRRSWRLRPYGAPDWKQSGAESSHMVPLLAEDGL